MIVDHIVVFQLILRSAQPASSSSPCSGCRVSIAINFAARRFQIGLNPEHRAVVVDELVLRVEIVQQLHHLRIRLGQILVVDPILRDRSLETRR